MVIVKQVPEKGEFDELKCMFKNIDKNGDGKLSKEELIIGTHYYQHIKSCMEPHILPSKSWRILWGLST
jgi:hypothetical protein